MEFFSGASWKTSRASKAEEDVYVKAVAPSRAFAELQPWDFSEEAQVLHFDGSTWAKKVGCMCLVRGPVCAALRCASISMCCRLPQPPAGHCTQQPAVAGPAHLHHRPLHEQLLLPCPLQLGAAQDIGCPSLLASAPDFALFSSQDWECAFRYHRLWRWDPAKRAFANDFNFTSTTTFDSYGSDTMAHAASDKWAVFASTVEVPAMPTTPSNQRAADGSFGNWLDISITGHHSTRNVPSPSLNQCIFKLGSNHTPNGMPHNPPITNGSSSPQ